ncbi:MAG: tetratricopeptide repeat protein [Elusimicrobia bacterium]|nr:tetratricopeptide repeat protein [Elusimicrobiota bacterium]
MKDKDSSLEIDSKNEIDLIEMGKFYFLSEKYDEAISEFEKVIKINPKSADAYFNMGIVKEAKNDIDGAKKMFEKTLEIKPDHKTAKKHLDKLVGI